MRFIVVSGGVISGIGKGVIGMQNFESNLGKPFEQAEIESRIQLLQRGSY